MKLSDFEEVGARWSAAMRRGDFEAAWRATDTIEHQRRALEASGRLVWHPHHLTWDGTPFEGRDVLVRCNHGLGDTLQFVRYVPRVCSVARGVTLLVQPHLLPLFEGSSAFGDVRNGWTDAPPPRHDVEIEIMELPYAFRSSVETLPNAVPYLPLEPLRRWRHALPSLDPGAFKVGLLWAASEWDTSRSIPLELFEPLALLHKVKLYSLQQGEEAARVDAVRFPVEPLHVHTADIAAAAGAMLKLDLVITVDGMAAHLAGALGRPVWVLLKHECDWRWMVGRSDSPWYPTMRLFRQRAAGDWRGVLEAVAAQLEAVQRSGVVDASYLSPAGTADHGTHRSGGDLETLEVVQRQAQDVR